MGRYLVPHASDVRPVLFALYTRHPACGARNPRADAPVEGCVTIQVEVGVVAELVETQRRTGNTVQRAMHVAHALAAQVSSTMHSPRSFRPCVCVGWRKGGIRAGSHVLSLLARHRPPPFPSWVCASLTLSLARGPERVGSSYWPAASVQPRCLVYVELWPLKARARSCIRRWLTCVHLVYKALVVRDGVVSRRVGVYCMYWTTARHKPLSLALPVCTLTDVLSSQLTP